MAGDRCRGNAQKKDKCEDDVQAKDFRDISLSKFGSTQAVKAVGLEGCPPVLVVRVHLSGVEMQGDRP